MRISWVIVVFVCVSITLISVQAHALFNTAKVTLIVVDEVGKPLEGFDAGVGFEKNMGSNTDTVTRRGLTDANGRFTATGNCSGYIGYGARKDGYYRSHYDYEFKDVSSSRWEPWNPVLTIVMRKITNPVPMFARYVGMERKVEFPELKKDIGFDLVVSDWVAPYGNGKSADFIFNLEKKFSDTKNFKSVLTITFHNENDGIINIKENLTEGSIYKLPRFAPEVGYLPVIKSSRNRARGVLRENYNQNDNYIFRVRSASNDDNAVALYGKIRGPIEVSGLRRNKPKIYFKYYLNPDGSRNLEFDTSRNLFGKLPRAEQVREP